MLETHTFGAAQKVVAFDVEVIERQFVFFHAAVAQHFDLAAGHAFSREGVFLGAGGFLGDKHGQPLVVGCLGIRARKKGHDLCAGGMGDPRFVAGHRIIAVIIFDRTGAQRTQVRARIRLGEDGCGQRLSACQTGQPLLLLLFCTAANDQFGCNFRTGAKAANTDIAARKLLGDHTHRRLGQAKPAVFFGNGQAEHTHLGQLFDDLHRDQLVLEVPFVGKGLNLLNRIAAKLLADHFQLFIQPRGTNGDVGGLLLHQFHKAGARGLGVAALGQLHHRRRHQRAHLLLGHADVLQAQDFALVHWDATVDLPKVFTKGDLVQQLFGLTKCAGCLQTFGPVLHLAQGLYICGQPRQPMRRRLVLLNQRTADAIAVRDCGAKAVFRGLQYFFAGRDSICRQCQKIRQNSSLREGHILSVMGHEKHPFQN